MIVFVFDERRDHFGFQNLNNASLVFWATPRRRVTGVDVAAAAGAAMVAASGVVVVAWLHFFGSFFLWKTVEPASITILEIYRTIYNFLI